MARHGGVVEDAIVVDHSASWYWYKRNKNALFITVAIVFVAIAGMVTYASFFGTKSPPKAVAATSPVLQKSAPKTTDVIAPVVQTNAGVELRGCGGDDAWLKNTNPCSVLVRYVWKVGNSGEQTVWMKEFVGSLKSTERQFDLQAVHFQPERGLVRSFPAIARPVPR